MFDALESTAASVLDAALSNFIVATATVTSNLPAVAPRAAARRASAVAAVNLAKIALSMDKDIDTKLATAVAAGYSAAFFGLPQNTLLATTNKLMGMFVMTANQRRAVHQQAASILQNYVTSLKKGNAMSGILQNGSVRDGSLGVLMQQGASRDGVLGSIMHQPGASRDGSLGSIMHQPGASRDGSLGEQGVMPPQQSAFRDGTLGRVVAQQRAARDGVLGFMPPPQFAFRDGTLGAPASAYYPPGYVPHVPSAPRPQWSSMSSGGGFLTSGVRHYNPAAARAQKRRLSGLSGGCGCSGGMGADEAAAAPFYQKPLVIGGAAVALGIVLYAVTRK